MKLHELESRGQPAEVRVPCPRCGKSLGRFQLCEKSHRGTPWWELTPTSSFGPGRRDRVGNVSSIDRSQPLAAERGMFDLAFRRFPKHPRFGWEGTSVPGLRYRFTCSSCGFEKVLRADGSAMSQAAEAAASSGRLDLS